MVPWQKISSENLPENLQFDMQKIMTNWRKCKLVCDVIWWLMATFWACIATFLWKELPTLVLPHHMKATTLEIKVHLLRWETHACAALLYYCQDSDLSSPDHKLFNLLLHHSSSQNYLIKNDLFWVLFTGVTSGHLN